MRSHPNKWVYIYNGYLEFNESDIDI
jgi:hypothetical protein